MTMVSSQDNNRSLLTAGLWLAATGCILAAAYGFVASALALALALQLGLVAAATWAVRKLHDRRRGASDRSLPSESLHSAAQTAAVVLGSVAAIAGLIAAVQLLQQALGIAPREEGGAILGTVCLAGAFVWLVLVRSLRSIPITELPEAQPLAVAFREAQWVALLAAAGLIGAGFHPPLTALAGWIVLIWVMAICAETLLRLIAALVIPADTTQPPAIPIQLLLREAVFAAANPLSGLQSNLERWLGVSLRSTWAITFIKRSVLPLAAILVLLSWGLTSLSIVETNQMAVRENFGRVTGDPLLPGLHVKLPWPMGRIRALPVKTVQQLPIGYVESDQLAISGQPRALLWTKPHAKEEFALVLGGGSELVAVNAIVYFKIAEDPQGLLDYVYQQSAPDETLTAFAYRALMEETRGRTLDEILAADRAAFARRVVDSVRLQAKEARLGVEVVDFALLNLHPPIEAGASYLEVINARLDAGRRVTEAEGARQVALLNAETQGAASVGTARAQRSRRVSTALGEVAEFNAVAKAKNELPSMLRLRLWIESLENALANQRLFLVDRTLLEEGGEILLDTRRIESTHLPPIDSVLPNLPMGDSK